MSELKPSRFINSNKRSDGILVDENEYEYRMKSVRGETTYWTCRQKDSKKCSARATTILVGEEVFVKSFHAG